jgi:hypothetical protein
VSLHNLKQYIGTYVEEAAEAAISLRRHRQVSNPTLSKYKSEANFYFLLFISVHMVNTAKQIQLLHSITVYLFNVRLLVHLPDMIRQ